MRAARRALFVLPALLAGLGPAAASSGMVCNIDDQSVKFRADSAFSGGPGSLINFGATLELRLTGAPADFRTLKFDGSGVPQNWVDGDEIKLEVYFERPDGPFGSVRLAIETAAIDEGTYRGRYALTILNAQSEEDSDMQIVETNGEASCLAE